MDTDILSVLVKILSVFVKIKFFYKASSTIMHKIIKQNIIFQNQNKQNRLKTSFCINLSFPPIIPVITENVLLLFVNPIMLPTMNYVLINDTNNES